MNTSFAPTAVGIQSQVTVRLYEAPKSQPVDSGETRRIELEYTVTPSGVLRDVQLSTLTDPIGTEQGRARWTFFDLPPESLSPLWRVLSALPLPRAGDHA